MAVCCLSKSINAGSVRRACAIFAKLRIGTSLFAMAELNKSSNEVWNQAETGQPTQKEKGSDDL